MPWPRGGGSPGPLDLKSEAAQEAQEEREPTLTPEQQAGVKLAWAVGALITVVTVFIVGDWIVTNALLPALPDSVVEATTPQEITTAQSRLDNYVTLREAEQVRSARMFDVVVATTLLPVFTAILGYIFGTRQAG